MRKHRESGKKIQKVMVYLMAALMFGSLFGVVFFGFHSGGSDTLRYNDFRFVVKGNLWSTTVDGREALFSYFPTDVELVLADFSAISRLRGVQEIDVTSDFHDLNSESIALAQFQMGVTLNNFNVYVRKGFIEENPANFEIITCEDATQFVPVVHFRSGNSTRVYVEGDCIIAEAANQADFIKMKDRMVYGIFGII
jgi:hypothetical protein